MNYYLNFIYKLLFVFILSCQTTIEYEKSRNEQEKSFPIKNTSSGVYDENGNKQKGQFFEYFPNGDIKKEENYKKGKLHGKVAYYNKNGEKKEERLYEKNQLIHSKNLTYHPNGNVSTLQKFKNNKLDGTSIEYNLQGKEKEITNYSKGELYKKEVLEYYPNQSIKRREVIDYKKQKYLKVYDYYESGELQFEKNYKDKKLDGIFVHHYKGVVDNVDQLLNDYYGDGEVELKGIYKENQKYSGEFLLKTINRAKESIDIIERYKHGKKYEEIIFCPYNNCIDKKVIYKNYAVDKIIQYLNESGTQKIEGTYKDNREYNGQFIKFQNQIKLIISYRKGILEGEYVEFYKDNKIKIKGIYKDKNPYSGQFSNFSIDKNHRIETFYQGKKISNQKIKYNKAFHYIKPDQMNLKMLKINDLHNFCLLSFIDNTNHNYYFKTRRKNNKQVHYSIYKSYEDCEEDFVEMEGILN